MPTKAYSPIIYALKVIVLNSTVITSFKLTNTPLHIHNL